MDEHQALVSAILRSPRIKNKLVVLCEGDHFPIEDGRAPSPQMYRRQEKTPDSNFYKACVPTGWHGSRLPVFFNCGGRPDVIRTFEALQQAHYASPADSYLTPEKLYAIVDLDLQADQMPAEYRHLWRTTEDVHAALYHDGALKADVDDRHRIWVTALIHKEAFFVLPEVAATWTDDDPPSFRDAPLDLRTLHGAAAERLAGDKDLAAQLDVAKARLLRFAAGQHLPCASGEALGASWQAMAEHANDEEYRALVTTLLAVAKIKPLWSEIVPNPRHGRTLPPESFREALALNIARSIAHLEPGAHPLASFFAWLEPRR
jgi:hypothetical protein